MLHQNIENQVSPETPKGMTRRNWLQVMASGIGATVLTGLGIHESEGQNVHAQSQRGPTPFARKEETEQPPQDAEVDLYRQTRREFPIISAKEKEQEMKLMKKLQKRSPLRKMMDAFVDGYYKVMRKDQEEMGSQDADIDLEAGRQFRMPRKIFK